MHIFFSDNLSRNSCIPIQYLLLGSYFFKDELLCFIYQFVFRESHYCFPCGWRWEQTSFSCLFVILSPHLLVNYHFFLAILDFYSAFSEVFLCATVILRNTLPDRNMALSSLSVPCLLCVPYLRPHTVWNDHIAEELAVEGDVAPWK